MYIKKEVYREKDDSIAYIECIYDSSNILKTTYFPLQNKLFIYFKHGGTYSYLNINSNLYEEFENCESHGKFFAEKIKNNPKYPYLKEFKLYESEIEECKKIIKESKDNKNESTNK